MIHNSTFKFLMLYIYSKITKIYAFSSVNCKTAFYCGAYSKYLGVIASLVLTSLSYSV